MDVYQRHSAVIEVMTSPWYEPGYQATALICDLHYTTVPHVQSQLESVRDCIFPQKCLETDLIVERRSLECYGMRQCGSNVDLNALEIAVWHASQSVRLLKREIDAVRTRDEYDRDSHTFGDDAGSFDISSHSFYKKAYDMAL